MTDRPIQAAAAAVPEGPSARGACVTLFGALLGASLWLSLSDHLPVLLTNLVEGRQALAHLAMHASLSIVALLAFRRHPYRTFASLLGFAVAVEVAQVATLTRQVSLEDFAANVAGVLVGSALFVACRAWRRSETDHARE